jgi:hypothetical protein
MKAILFITAIMLAFQVNYAQIRHENFTFELRFGPIKGGEAKFFTKDTIVNGIPKMHMVLHAYTTGVVNKLYGVNDRFESLVNRESLLPMVSNKWLHEQNYRFTEKITYHHDSLMVYSNKSGWYHVEKGICEVSSLVYHLRHSDKLNNLRKGQIIEVPFWDTNEWYMLRMRFAGYEKVKTRLGVFNCIRLEPLSVAGRFFDKKNPMNVWITNDNRKLPVLMELNFSVGSVKCELSQT